MAGEDLLGKKAQIFHPGNIILYWKIPFQISQSWLVSPPRDHACLRDSWNIISNIFLLAACWSFTWSKLRICQMKPCCHIKYRQGHLRRLSLVFWCSSWDGHLVQLLQVQIKYIFNWYFDGVGRFFFVCGWVFLWCRDWVDRYLCRFSIWGVVKDLFTLGVGYWGYVQLWAVDSHEDAFTIDHSEVIIGVTS